MNKSRLIKFIYFDVGGVIIDNNRAMQGVANHSGIAFESVRGVVERLWQDSCRGILPEAVFMEELRNVGVKHPTDDFINFVTEFQDPFPQTLEFINELSALFTLGILSNAERGMLEMHMEKKKYPKHVWSAIIESGTHGTIKPERKIYEIAQKASGVKPEEIFFIDDQENNVEAAKSFGWSGSVFDNTDIKKTIAKIKKELQL